MALMGVSRFKRFFRAAAGLDVDKDDLKRYSDFVNRKVYDLLLIGQAVAKTNGRDIIEPWDLPVTGGLQESVHEFERMDEEVDLWPILEQLATLPPLDFVYSEETEERLPGLVGGLSVALARTFKVLDPKLKNPHTAHWEQASRIFDLLLYGPRHSSPEAQGGNLSETSSSSGAGSAMSPTARTGRRSSSTSSTASATVLSSKIVGAWGRER